ncbi:MAG: hypothetical protein N2690_01830 [Rhodocyclaceae bacterium]|nr:hypothetical protein [Rhodocyclaceae bacterium]
MALAIDFAGGDDAAMAMAHPPVRAFDAGLPQRIAQGGGTVWEAQQVAGLMAWLQRYERVLHHIAVHGGGEAAMMACRVLAGDDPLQA